MSRLVSAHERMPGEVPDREPHVVKPVAAEPSKGPVQRLTIDVMLGTLFTIDDELTAVRAIAGADTTGHEWGDVASRLERVQRIASQASRWARTLSMRAHKEMR